MQMWQRGSDAQFVKKIAKFNPFGVKSVLKPNCKRFNESATREYFNLDQDSQVRNTPFQLPCNIFHHLNDDERCIYFASFMTEQHLRTKSKTCMHLENFKNFLIFTGQKHIKDTSSATNGKVHQ